jgi:hypothetical protein
VIKSLNVPFGEFENLSQQTQLINDAIAKSSIRYCADILLPSASVMPVTIAPNPKPKNKYDGIISSSSINTMPNAAHAHHVQ